MKATEHENAPAARGKRVWLIWAAALLLAALALVGGFTLAWLYNGLDIQTLLPLEPPSNIALYEPEKDTSLGPISVGGAAGSGKPVTLHKVFRVKASGNYQLEIAHTTNLQGLQFKIYKAEKATDSTNAADIVTENGIKYTYQKDENGANELVTGSYINAADKKSPADKVYAEANSQFQPQNYAVEKKNDEDKGYYDNVQTHAKALYWLGSEMYPGEKDNANANHNDLYICEITWTETANKETDLFYIMARLPQVTTSQGGSSGV